MLRMSVENFSGFEVLANTSAMSREIKNNTIGYLKIGEKVYPVIQIEVTYDTDWYKKVNIAEKVIIPVAILGKTDFDASRTEWFIINGISAGSHEAFYDYLIPVNDKWVYTDESKAKEQRFPSFKDLGKWPELCEIVDEGDGRVTMYFSSKFIMHAVATRKELEAIYPVLHFRQEKFSMLKCYIDEDEYRPVLRFSEGNLTKYYVSEHEHAESLFQKFAVHLVEIDEDEVFRLKPNGEMGKMY